MQIIWSGVSRAAYRVGVIAVLAAASLLFSAAASNRAAGDGFYCNQNVAGGQECNSFVNTAYNANQAYAQHGPGIQVCERATVRFQAQNASRRCGGSPVDSGCDLAFYPNNTIFSMYVDNHACCTAYLVGKVYSVTCA